MASRENTTIQVALILSVMTTITLAVFLYMSVTKANIRKETLAKNEESIKKMEDKNEDTLAKIEAFKYMIGDPLIKRGEVDNRVSDRVRNGGDMKEIEDLLVKFKNDMDLYGQGMAEETRSYASIPANLLQTIKQQNDLNTKLENMNRQLADDKATTVQNESGLTKQALDARLAAETVRDSERSAFNTDRQRITQEKSTQAQALQQQVIVANDAKEIKVAEVAALGKENNILQQTIDAMKILRQPKSERFEVPDGRITMVHQQNNTVWIDLGAAHGLKELTTFSVYDIKEPGVMHEKSDIKAKIQVTRILNDRLAEGRILDDSMTNPVLRGDLIHSPNFQVATQIHFALAGIFDLDGDGVDDFNKVKYMITAIGGVIDAEIRSDGTREGKVTVSTQYLLKGTTQGLISTKGYNDLLREVQFYDVEQLTFPTFLKYVGYKREVLTVSLGRSADSSQFLGDLQNREIAPTLPDETRKQRFPPRRGNDGAF